MKECTKIAELIYKRVRDKKSFVLDKSKGLDLLLAELKKVIGKTKLKLKYEFNNINDLIEQINLKGGKELDLTLAPNRYQDKEFILWLAVIIENITDEITLDQRREKPNLPIKPQVQDNGEAIQAYLNSKEFKQQ